MLKIGLTGGIGAGKTTVARLFEILHISVYYADQKAKYLMENDPALHDALISLFGSRVYQGNNLNRKYLSDLVFNNKELLNRLNSLVHPVVRNDFSEWCKCRVKETYVIQEAALIFESGFYKDFDMNILVTSPEDLRIKRVSQRDHSNEGEVRLRIENQMTDEQKKKLADLEIRNSENELLIPQVLEIHNKFVSLKKF